MNEKYNDLLIPKSYEVFFDEVNGKIYNIIILFLFIKF